MGRGQDAAQVNSFRTLAGKELGEAWLLVRRGARRSFVITGKRSFAAGAAEDLKARGVGQFATFSVWPGDPRCRVRGYDVLWSIFKTTGNMASFPPRTSPARLVSRGRHRVPRAECVAWLSRQLQLKSTQHPLRPGVDGSRQHPVSCLRNHLQRYVLEESSDG